MMKQTDLSRADLNLLVLFDTVIRERHVGRAAQRLHLSASAVSHGLKRLRALLGDPLFLKTPRGVVPTERAQELDPLIQDILSRVGKVLSMTDPFVPGTSRRRFALAAPDGVSAVVLPPLLKLLSEKAPHIDLSLQQALPRRNESVPEPAWQDVLVALDAHLMDMAILPLEEFPARFSVHPVYEEDFVIAMRRGHACRKKLTLDDYCSLAHLVVSEAGDPFGFVDQELAKKGRKRRVALTVPNFMFAISLLSASDFVSALPRHFVELHGPRFGVVGVEPPIRLPKYSLNLVLPRVALVDDGVSWLVKQMVL